jgi:hypothetical protein
LEVYGLIKYWHTSIIEIKLKAPITYADMEVILEGRRYSITLNTSKSTITKTKSLLLLRLNTMAYFI